VLLIALYVTPIYLNAFRPQNFAYTLGIFFLILHFSLIVIFPVLTLYFLVVVNNFYSDMLDRIPLGFYVDNPYFFFKSEGHKRFLE